MTVTGPVALAVSRQAEAPLTAIFELDLDVAGAPAGIDLDSVAHDKGSVLMRLQDQTRELEPTIRAADDEAPHARGDERLPENPAKFAHRAIIGKITRSGRYRSGQTGLTVDQLA